MTQHHMEVAESTDFQSGNFILLTIFAASKERPNALTYDFDISFLHLCDYFAEIFTLANKPFKV